jgi:hypothetical protein
MRGAIFSVPHIPHTPSWRGDCNVEKKIIEVCRGELRQATECLRSETPGARGKMPGFLENELGTLPLKYNTRPTNFGTEACLISA